MIKKTQLAGAALAAATLLSMAPMASAQQVIIARVAPPAPVVEVAPAPRAGYVWTPGYHEYRNNQYVWVSGHWLADRPGYEYRTPRWVERDGHWQMVGGNWERNGPYGDRDRDGIANQYDNHNNRGNQHAQNRYGPNGDLDRDGIANQYDRDRDGDGVRNNRDARPDDRRYR